jgi:hypothetical protein
METVGASQYRAGSRNNNEYYRPLPVGGEPAKVTPFDGDVERALAAFDQKI